MKSYIEITLLPTDKFQLNDIWSQLMIQIHLAIVESNSKKCGVSFPKLHPKGVGNILRIFATHEELKSLNLDKKLSKLINFIHLRHIAKVPDNTKFATYAKVKRPKTKDERIAHQAKRRGVSIEESAKSFENFNQADFLLPFLRIKSMSSDQKFAMFIKKTKHDLECIGEFDSYGLSSTSTVPEF